MGAGIVNLIRVTPSCSSSRSRSAFLGPNPSQSFVEETNASRVVDEGSRRAAYEVRAASNVWHSSVVPAATTRERPTRSSGAASNGGSSNSSIARPHSRTSSCAGRDVDRARGLERADRVDAAGGEVAERERERAHDPQAVREPDHRRRPLARPSGRRRLEREDLDRLLRPHRARAERRSGTRPGRASAVHSSPEPKS